MCDKTYEQLLWITYDRFHSCMTQNKIEQHLQSACLQAPPSTSPARHTPHSPQYQMSCQKSCDKPTGTPAS